MSFGGRTIRVTQTLNDRQFLAELVKQQRELAKLIAKMNKVGQAGQRAGQKTSQSMRKATGHMHKFAGAVSGLGGLIGGIYAIVAQLRREYDNLIERQNKGATTNIPYETALSKALFNTQGLLGPNELKSLADQTAKDTGNQVSQTKILEVIAAAVSSRGVSNKRDLAEAVSAGVATLRISPHLETEEAMAIAAGTSSFGARYGSAPEDATGFLMNVGRQSNIRGLDNLVNNAVPAIGAMTSLGFDLNSSGAFISALSQGMDDPSGETTRTAAINFGISLRERFRKSDGSFTDRDAINAMEQMRSDPELRRKFFEGGIVNNGKKFGKAKIGKGRAEPTLESILTPGTVYYKKYNEFRSTLGGFKEGGKTYESYAQQIKENTPVSQASRGFEGAIEEERLNNPQEAISGIIREKLKELYQAQGYSDAGIRADSLIQDIKTGGVRGLSRTADSLRRQEEDLRNGTTVNFPTRGTIGGGSFTTPATPQELQQADSIHVLVGLLEKLNGTM